MEVTAGVTYQGLVELRMFQTESNLRGLKTLYWALGSLKDGRVLAERRVLFSMRWKSWPRLQLEGLVWAPLLLLGLVDDVQKVVVPVISFEAVGEPQYLVIDLDCDDAHILPPALLVLTASLKGWRYWVFEWRVFTALVVVGTLWSFQMVIAIAFIAVRYAVVSNSNSNNNNNEAPHGNWN